jgi:hypothetical protein
MSLSKLSISQLQHLLSSDGRRLLSRQLRYAYLRLLRLQGTPAEIGRGIAVGLLAGMFPFFGVHTILALLAATAVRGNKLAAAAATWVVNPLTCVPIYAFNFQVGRWLLQSDRTTTLTSEQSVSQLLQQGSDFASSLLVGSGVVGAIVAIAGYLLALPLVRLFKHQMRIRQLERRRSQHAAAVSLDG